MEPDLDRNPSRGLRSVSRYLASRPVSPHLITLTRWTLSATVCLLLALGAFVWWAHNNMAESIDRHTGIVTRAYPGDRVEASIAALRSDSLSLIQKNHVFWLLAQVGDERALPVLDSLYTGEECRHRHGQYFCQHELKKARSAIRKQGLNGVPKSLPAAAWGALLVVAVVGRWEIRKRRKEENGGILPGQE